MSGVRRCREEASGTSHMVFISHAGVQKASFAVWLQRELGRHGVSAFLDETSLRLGDAADAEMEAALRGCSIVVAVLTPAYLRSAYCLAELHWALHPAQPHPPLLQSFIGPADSAAGRAPQLQPEPVSVQRSKGAPTLFPVFHLTSDLAALQEDMHQQVEAAGKGCAPPAELQRLQQASRDLAAMCRFTGDRLDSHGKLDTEHVDAIVAEVLRRLARTRCESPKYAVDLGARVQKLLPLLQPDRPGGVRVLSLHGMGGIGKTTLARQLFESLSSGSLCFSSRVFLEVGQDARLLDKQRQLMEALASSSMPRANSAAEQQQQLSDCVRAGGALLLVLDDVWAAGQRDGLLCLDALQDGSRIVLTGRNASNLHPEIAALGWLVRPVEALAPQQAEQLLCRHAFAADQAPPGYAAAVQRALAVCGCLPLALQVVGAGLRSQPPDVAEAGVESLLATPHISSGRTDATGKELAVLDLLQWSFEHLPSDNHRHFFLDATLLMRDRPLEHLLQAWAGILQQDEEEDGVQHPSTPVQLQRSAEALWSACVGATLLSCRTSENELYSRVQAHHCIVEMAEKVHKQPMRHASWSLNSLFVSRPLPQAGTPKAEASRLRCWPSAASVVPAWTWSQLMSRHQHCRLAAVDLQHSLEHSAADGSAGGSSQQVCLPRQLLYLRLMAAPQQWAFGGQLRVLDVSGNGVVGCSLPDSIAACTALRHLRLSIQHLQSLPENIGRLSSLATLDVCGCWALRQLPNSIGSLSSLVMLNVSKCWVLQQLPGSIGSLFKLETLDISSCEALQQLPDSIGSLSSLRILDISQCSTLQQLPAGINSLPRLHRLLVSNCRALQQLPANIGSTDSAEVLDCSELYALQQLPDSIGSLVRLKTLNLSSCKLLQQLPDSIGSLSNLVTLVARGCRVLQRLPDSIGSLVKLTYIDFYGCQGLQKLPNSIRKLPSLQRLVVTECTALRQLPDSIGSLVSCGTLDVWHCWSLQELPDSIGSLASLKALNLHRCKALQQLPDSIGSLVSLETLYLTDCQALQQLPNSIGSLVMLKTLHVRECQALQQLPDSIGGLSHLERLCLSGCGALERLPDSISSLVSLKMLGLTHCTALQQLPDSIASLSSLQKLYITMCKALQQLPDGIGSLPSLELLHIKYCSMLQQLPNSIGRLSRLQRLDVSGCWALRQLPDSIGSLSSLQTLVGSDCPVLLQLPDSIGHLVSLAALDVRGCWALRQLPDSVGRLSTLVVQMDSPAEECPFTCSFWSESHSKPAAECLPTSSSWSSEPWPPESSSTAEDSLRTNSSWPAEPWPPESTCPSRLMSLWLCGVCVAAAIGCAVYAVCLSAGGPHNNPCRWRPAGPRQH